MEPLWINFTGDVENGAVVENALARRVALTGGDVFPIEHRYRSRRATAGAPPWTDRWQNDVAGASFAIIAEQIPVRYFFYGTLLDPDVRRAVLGRTGAASAGRPARLEGYLCTRLAGTAFPVIIAGDGHVDGAVFTIASERLANRIRAFEGAAYREIEWVVHAQPETPVRARLFVPLRSARFYGAWSLERWQRTDKSRLMRTLAGNTPLRAGR